MSAPQVPTGLKIVKVILLTAHGGRLAVNCAALDALDALAITLAGRIATARRIPPRKRILRLRR
jgi:hypothetical protein